MRQSRARPAQGECTTAGQARPGSLTGRTHHLRAQLRVRGQLGMAVMPSHYRDRHSTASNGTFGVAAAAVIDPSRSHLQTIGGAVRIPVDHPTRLPAAQRVRSRPSFADAPAIRQSVF